MSPPREDAPPGGEGLSEYRRKRDPGATPEPFEGDAEGGQPRFVVQRHSARRLHYDLRLERDGVLASWAVPKGLPTSPGARRLAVHTEDHPLKYIDFEGQIPKGQYGAGTMDVYDTGPYEVIEEKKDGGLTIRLHGEVLRGVWTLVPARMDGDRKNWLLIRRSDADAPKHVAVPGKKYEPMLAALVETPPPAKGWIAEVKLDGFRALARLRDGEVELWSRRGNDLTERFRVVANDLGRGLRSPNVVVDGEVVAVGPDGKPSFSLLQTSEGRLLYYVFDLLELDGESWCDRPLEERRERLKELVDATSKTVRYSDAFPDPAALLEVARKHELEGIICKRSASRYLPGKRTRDWLKIKARPSQEFVIAGYTVGQGKRARFGALVLAVHDEQRNLRYVGNCGTGFTENEIDRLLAALQPLRRDTPPLTGVPRDRRLRGQNVAWVEPELVCEVEFAEWTHDGHVRAPAYKGLRDDKRASEIVHETAAPVPAEEPPPEQEWRNLDKVFFPNDGITKGDLIDYYRAVSDALVPHLRDRAFTMKRYPNGITGGHFFQKDAPAHMPEWIPRAMLDAGGHGRDKGKGPIGYAVVNDEPSLLWMIAMGCIDLHVWYSRIQTPEEPDYVLFDLDPSPDVGYAEVVRVALLINQLLGHLGLHGYPKTSGSDGMHVCVPVGPGHTFEDTRLFANALAGALERTQPGLVTTVWAKSRRRGVFIDYKQNGLGATIASVYSVRPHDGAPVSTPLAFEELEEGLDPRTFTMDVVLERVREHGDLFAPVLEGGQDVKALLAGGFGARP
jgi:bifunctional non-homologous end joining protein LigD